MSSDPENQDACDADCVAGGPHSNACVSRASEGADWKRRLAEAPEDDEPLGKLKRDGVRLISHAEVDRAAEKQASRDEDARRLAAGEVTREQLWKENTFLPADKTSIDWSKIPILEESDDERLTDEERAEIESDTSNLDANATHYAKKLLRIHDRLIEQMDKARSLLETARDNYSFKGWDTDDLDAWLKDSPASEARPWRR